MYYYIVDPQKLTQKEFERVQNVLYSSLSEFRISGEIVRITGLRTVQQLVENAFAHEAKTIVAVGGDDTLHEVINAIGKREMVLGFIPIVDSEMADIFGIKDIPQAVKTIAFRRVEEIDLGVVNENNYFLSKLLFGSPTAPTMEIDFIADEKYQAKQTIVAGVIVNSRINAKISKIGNPTDGLLDVLLLPEVSKWRAFLNRKEIAKGFYESLPLTSTLHIKTLDIKLPAGLPLKIADRVIARTPATISVAPKMLRLIVGKERSF